VAPIYIIGSFGVFFDFDGIQIIDSPPWTAKIEGGYIHGYPYYAGELSFKRKLKMATLSEETEITMMFDHLDNNLHDCIELILNGQTLGVRPWSPYQWKGNRNLIKQGENEIEVKIVNTLVGMLDGKYFDYDHHQLLDIK
jgi:hypothetical protein